jgi:hypothetical protein
MKIDWIKLHEKRGVESEYWTVTEAANTPNGVLIRTREERYDSGTDRTSCSVALTHLDAVRATADGELVRQGEVD